MENESHALDNRPRYVRIMDDLRTEILSGRLIPEQKLPSESQLMKQYGVSRIVAVNALTALAREGLIYRVHGKGSFVAKNSNDLFGPLGVEQMPGQHHISLIVQGFGDNFSSGLVTQINRTVLMKNLFCSQYFSGFFKERDPAEIEEHLIRFVLRSGTQGLLLFPAMQEVYNKELLHLADMDFPVVLLDRELIGLGFPCVQTDHRLTGRMAAEVCIKAGHRNIAYCTSAPQIQPLIQRKEGFERTMHEHGLPFGGELLVSEPDTTRAKEQMVELMKDGVTAFIGVTACYAQALLDILREGIPAGVPTPSILTIDKAETEDMDIRAPSYIAQDTAAVGAAAVELLCQRILRTHRQYEVIKIPPQHIDNGSVYPL